MTPDPMVWRCLSVREPWCSAIVDGHKPIENRRGGFPKNHRGLVFLHAAKTWSWRGSTDRRVLGVYPQLCANGALADGPPEPFVLGYVIGCALLDDVHPDGGCCRPWGESEYREDEGTVRTGLVHLVFEHPRRFAEPIPARGYVGLWKPDTDLVLELADTFPRG